MDDVEHRHDLAHPHSDVRQRWARLVIRPPALELEKRKRNRGEDGVMRPAELSARTFCTFRSEWSSRRRPSDVAGSQCRREVERRERMVDDHPHDHFAALAAAL
jgi:hypothetical protein